MRTGTIIIGGQPYPVKGLSVRQSLTEGSKAAKENDVIEMRMRQVAIALQNAGAFLPDPNNPKGQFLTSDKTVDEVVTALNADIFDGMEEWYAAEVAVGLLNQKKPVDAPKTDAPKTDEVNGEAQGEQQATA